MKKIITVLLTVLLLFVLTGCNKQDTDRTKPALQIGIRRDPFVTDYKNNYLTQYLENLHGCNLSFYMLPDNAGESRTKISLMAASNDLPETIWGGGFTRELILEYGSKGAFIPLNRYLSDPEKTPNFHKIPEEIRKQMLLDTRSADGNNYSFPRWSPETWNRTPYRMYINRAWLSTLGLEAPETTDELRDALIAFRDRDPNGNGRQDELGVFGWYTGGYGENIITALINAFIYWNPDQLGLDASGNEVIAPFTENGFRQALRYLNGLFSDGLLEASTFTTDQQTFRAILNANPMVVGLTSSGSVGSFPDADNNPNYLAMAPILPPLSSPNSPGYTPYTPYTAEHAAVISNRAKNPELAVKIMDSFYEQELSIITRYGEENIDWTRDPQILATDTNALVELGLYPGLSLTQIRDVWVTPSARHWRGNTPMYVPLEQGNTVGSLQNPYAPDRHTSQHNAVNFIYLVPRHPEHILPVLFYSVNDGTVIGQLSAAVNEYVRQSIAEFIIGTRDINSDTAWNAYRRELDNMGLQQWIRIAQATYEKQLSINNYQLTIRN